MADLPRFDLGQAGLVLTSSPLHGQPGQLTKAQNIEFKRLQGLGGMGSRAPLVSFSKTFLAQMAGNGSVLSACAVPLPSPIDNLTLPVVVLGTSGGYYISQNGTTYIVITTNVAPVGPMAFTNGILAYVGPYSAGATTLVVNNTPISIPGYISGLVGHPNGNFYVSVITSTAFTSPTGSGGWNGGSFNNITQAASNLVQGKVLEVSGAGVVLRTIGETFGQNNSASTNGPTSPPFTTYATQDGRTGSGSQGRGPMGGAPGPLAVGTSGKLYALFGSYYLSGFSGVHTPTLDLYLNIDYIFLNPATDTSWQKGNIIGVARVEVDVSGAITQGPADILADAFSTDTPWWSGFAPSPSTVSSVVGGTTGTLQGSTVQSSRQTSTKQFADPNGASIPGYAYFQGLIMFNSDIFIAYYSASSVGADPAKVQIYTASSDDASTLTLDHDVLTSVAPVPPSVHVYPGKPFVLGGALYWPFYGLAGHLTSGFVLKRTTGGVWSVAASGLSNLTGFSAQFSVAV